MIYLFFIKAFIGSCLASHACVIYERNLLQQDFIFSRSHCSSCGYELMLYDEIPIISYLLLKGRCRYCNDFISYDLFRFELLGAISFLKINFFNQNDLLTSIIFFFLLLIAIFDWHDQEFPIILLAPSFIVILYTRIPQMQNLLLVEKVELIIVSSVMLYFSSCKKLGTGDLLVYLTLALYFTPEFANLVFLGAASLLLSYAFFNKKNKREPFAFIPYIYFSTILCYFFS